MDVALTTRRLILRQPRPDDAPRIARLLNNFHVAGNLSRVPYPYREADAATWLATWQADRPAAQTGFSLELVGEGLIGHCGFHQEAAAAEIGYWLGEPFWNRGLMTEAAERILAWYFETTGAPSVVSGVFAFNRASLAVQQKLGFTQTGSSHRLCLARHEEVRHIDTELTRARWADRRAQMPVKEAS
ncbi:MAG: GNAT family N-acetyltransferase [Devosia sp.]